MTRASNSANLAALSCREAGSGPAVVCLHANASSPAQWRALTELLAPKLRVLAPDLSGSVTRLRDEVALIEPVLAQAGSPLALVGHSYGAAVALVTALADPARVSALALYEPTLFSLVDAETPPPNEADGIRNVAADCGRALDAGDADAAAERFIDYWTGAGAWRQTPDSRKPALAASVRNVRRWAHALFNEPAPLEAFRSLEVPVLYMVGKRTTASARAVAQILAAALPRVEVVELEGLGHMGPLTHAAAVNDAIRRFLERAYLPYRKSHLRPAAATAK